MQLVQLQYLISNLNINNQLVKTKRERWTPFEIHNLNLHNLNDEIFDNAPEINISREIIFNEIDIEKKILLTFYWGYPSGGRGNNFLNIINPENFAFLRGLLIDLGHEELSPQSFRLNGKRIGVGPSTITKFLYFFNVRLDGKKCLILDDRIKEVVKRKNFDELNDLHFKNNRPTTFDEYNAYNNIMHSLSAEMEIEPDQLELFLFLFPKIKKILSL